MLDGKTITISGGQYTKNNAWLTRYFEKRFELFSDASISVNDFKYLVSHALFITLTKSEYIRKSNLDFNRTMSSIEDTETLLQYRYTEHHYLKGPFHMSVLGIESGTFESIPKLHTLLFHCKILHGMCGRAKLLVPLVTWELNTYFCKLVFLENFILFILCIYAYFKINLLLLFGNKGPVKLAP